MGEVLTYIDENYRADVLAAPFPPFVPPPGYNVKTDSDYGYIPDRNASMCLLVIFGLSGVHHFLQACRWRMWFLIPTVVLACAGESAGWFGRYWSSFNGGLNNTAYLIQICCTIISPTPLLAAYFILLGRMIRVFGEEYSHTRLFTTIDIICLFVQAVGGTIASAQDNKVTQIGGYMMLGGIGLQLISLICYIILGTEFLLRFHYNKPYRTAAVSTDLTSCPGLALYYGETRRLYSLEKKAKYFLSGMALSVLCIFIRAVYRTIELSDGFRGRIIQTQVYFNVLDGMMIVIAVWSLNIFHPGWLLPRLAKAPATPRPSKYMKSSKSKKSGKESNSLAIPAFSAEPWSPDTPAHLPEEK